MSDVSIGATNQPTALPSRGTAAPGRHDSLKAILGEIRAGATVAALTLPFMVSAGVLAFAPLGPDYVASGAATGLLCAVAGGVVGALCRSSSFIATVPTAPMALIQASFIAALLNAFGGDVATALAVMPLSVVLSGVWQILFAWSGLARIVKFTPYPVLAGFVTGLSLKTFVEQAPRLFDLANPAALFDAVVAGAMPHLPLAVFGLLIVAVIRLTEDHAPKLPAMLVGLVAGSLAWHALMTLWPGLELGRTIGALSLRQASIGFPLGWQTLKSITTDGQLVQTILLTSLTLAAVGMLDFTFVIRTAQTLCDLRPLPRRDLVGQGIANFASAVTGGMGVTSSLNSTIMLFESGGRTRIAPLTTALVLLLAALFAAKLIAAMPLVVLTAMLISIAWKMWDRWCLQVLREAVSVRNPEARTRARRNLAIVVAVAAATVLGQPILGAVVGVLLACIVFIMEMSRPIIRRRLDCTHVNSKRIRSQQERAILAAHGGRTIVYDLQGVLFFGNAVDLAGAIQDVPALARTIVLDLHRVTDVDTSGATILLQIARRTHESGLRLLIAGGAATYLELLHETLAQETYVAFYPDLDSALEEAEDRVLEQHGEGPGWAGLAIHETDLASGLSARELSALTSRLRPASYKSGEALCRAGEPADRLWIITRGSVSVKVAGAFHARRIAALGPGTSVGEMGLLDRRPRSADVVADEAVEAHVLTAEDFDALLRDEAHLGQSLLATIARLTAQRLRETSEELRLAEI